MNKFCAIVLGFLLLSACGDGASPATGIGSLIGSSWAGNFSPSADNLVDQTTKVKLDFRNDQSFLIAPVESALTGLVKGTYKEMPRNNVMLFDLQESTFDLLGKTGTQQNYNYELAGNELVLNGSNGKYFLVREGESTDGEGGTSISPLEGDWHCNPGDRSRWAVNLSSHSFRGSRSENGSRTLYFEGNLDHLNKSKGEAVSQLSIESSNYDPLVGTTLRMSQTSEKNATIRQIDENGNEVGAEITCSR